MKEFCFTDYKTRAIEVEVEGKVYWFQLKYEKRHMVLVGVSIPELDSGNLIRFARPIDFKYKRLTDHSWSNILWTVKYDLKRFLKYLISHFNTKLS